MKTRLQWHIDATPGAVGAAARETENADEAGVSGTFQVHNSDAQMSEISFSDVRSSKETLSFDVLFALITAPPPPKKKS